jgi:hypothetical protein
MRTHLYLPAAVLAAVMMVTAPRVEAAEGASSHYLPGASGDLLLAAPPPPGLLAANTVWWQSGSAGAAVLQGQVNVDLDLDVVLDLATVSYTFEQPVLGGTYSLGALVPFGYARLEGRATGMGGSISATGDSTNLSDIALIPLQLNWQLGQVSLKFAEVVIAPTGAYDVDKAVNLGRNYWSFDTTGAVTWMDESGSVELSFAPGLMLNTENPDTNYKTGAEFHADFTANYFLEPTLAVGVRGYYYRQVSDDSGSGAQLGGFRSRSFGMGPGVFWAPPSLGGRLSFFGKWMHDFSAKNRFESDYVTVGGAWKF